MLYQSLIPNCKLTLHTLCQHISISDNIEQYIVSAVSRRTRCQRLINFLLTRLCSEKDYMQFCYHLNIISVMTDLPYRLIAGTLLLYTYVHMLSVYVTTYNYMKHICYFILSQTQYWLSSIVTLNGNVFYLIACSVILTEFRSNGNWECNVPVYPTLSFHKSQPDYCLVNKHDLHTKST